MRRTQRGGVMVLTLAVLTGLVAVLASAAATQRVAFRAAVNRMEARRAERAAESAVQYVLANLVDQGQTATTLQDDWAALGDGGSERFVVGDVSFRIEVVDLAAKLNLNTAPQGELERLNFTTEQIESLLDWREPGREPRSEGGKDEYYNALPEPYNAKLRRLDTLDEIMLVKGFTPADLFRTVDGQADDASALETGEPLLYDLVTVESVSRDVAPNGQAKLNVNSQQATVQQIAQRAQLPNNLAAAIVQRRATQGPFANIGQVLALPGVNTQRAERILDNLSVTGQARVEGRLNLNTATEEALGALPDLPADAVQAILQRQSSGFTRLGEVVSLPGVSGQALQRLADRFAVNSQTLQVRVLAEAGAFSRAYEATVSLEGASPRTLRLAEAPGDAIARWGWDEEPTGETVIAEVA